MALDLTGLIIIIIDANGDGNANLVNAQTHIPKRDTSFLAFL